MRKLKFALPTSQNKVFSFFVPALSLRAMTKAQLFVYLAYILSYYTVFILLGLFAFARFSFPFLEPDTAIFAVLAFVIPVLLGINIIVSFLAHQKFSEPPFIVSILIFALGTTLTSVLATPASIKNTFGMDGFRALSSLFVMLMIGLFYLTNHYLRDRLQFRRGVKWLVVGLLGYLVVLLASTLTYIDLILNLSEILVILAIGFMFVAYIRRFRVLLAGGILALLGLIVSRLDLNPTLYVELYPFLIGSFCASFVILILLIKTSGKVIVHKYLTLSNYIRNYRALNRTRFLKLLRGGYLKVLLFSPLVLLVLIILTISQLNFSVRELDVVKSVESLFATQSVRTILLGMGITSYSDVSLVGNIIRIQGLLGIVSYIFIWLVAIGQALKVFFALLHQSSLYKLVLVLIYILIFVPVFGIFTYPGVFLSVTWWIAFAFIGVLSTKLQSFAVSTLETLEIYPLKFKSRKFKRAGFYGKYLLALLMFAVTLYVAYNFHLLATV